MSPLDAVMADMDLRKQSALRALDYVHSGMVLGLGTGVTAGYFLDLLGERLRAGDLRDILCVPTSESTACRADAAAIPLTDLSKHRRLDLVVDGADEVDPDLNLIKGLGRALLREKIVVVHASCFIVVVDQAKLVPHLGRGPLPIELTPFGAEAQVHWLASLGCRAELWREQDGAPAITDNGNYLARCWFPAAIDDPYRLAQILAGRPGIIEHGLFLDMATTVIVAGPDGTRILERAT